MVYKLHRKLKTTNHPQYKLKKKVIVISEYLSKQNEVIAMVGCIFIKICMSVSCSWYQLMITDQGQHCTGANFSNAAGISDTLNALHSQIILIFWREIIAIDIEGHNAS